MILQDTPGSVDPPTGFRYVRVRNPKEKVDDMKLGGLAKDLRITGPRMMNLMKGLARRLRPKSAKQITWFHQIDLGNGIITPGMDNTPERLANFGIPEDLRGWSVLDVGAWDGFFSFEAERRGASRVLATDYFCWGGGGWATKEGFDLAHQTLQSSVQDKRIDVLDLSPKTVGTFDLVLFLGVLYHMRHPLLALERVASVTKRQLILETHVDMLEYPRPAMAFYPAREINRDPTNWCGPNPPMIEAMLKIVGFNRIVLHNGPIWRTPDSPRVVFHAWK